MGEAADWEEGARPNAETLRRLASLEHELLEATRELHQRHREAAALRERLRAEREEREQLLTVVSHELRTPITVIKGYHRLLLDGEAGRLGAEQRRFLEESARACEKLDGFLQRVLDGSVEPADSEVLEVCTASLLDPIEGATASLRTLFEERGVKLVVAVDPERSRARFDRGAIERVMTNLLSNALRHAKSLVEIATREQRFGGRCFVEVAVSDDGPGVATEDRERIFEPYVQGGPPEGEVGLGLAICKRLVEAHGGAIGVGARSCGGARFAFTLPAGES